MAIKVLTEAALQAAKDAFDAAVAALSPEVQVRSWALTEGYLITDSITYDKYGNVTSANIEWPNAITGVISNVTADRNGWSSARLTYSGATKYVTVDVTRNLAGEVETVTATLTGF